jgi:MFS transporter, DHA2 family, methylenomycin A resistance protein
MSPILTAPRRALSRPREVSPYAVLVVMCVGYFLVLLDVTIVNVALPSIASGLGASVSGLQWVVDGYALALASLMLAGGTVGDLHGHKRVVLCGLVVFGFGSLGCALAPNVAVLAVARVFQGVGAALLLPGTLAIISHAFGEGREQAKAIGIWAGIGGLALPAGPLLGGALIAAFGWRAIFLINVPIVVLALIAASVLVGESTDRQGRRLDVVGVVLGVLALVAITFGFIEAGHSGAQSAGVLGATVAGVVFVAAFVVVERARGDDAMLPLALFRRPVFTVANVGAATMNLCTLGMLFVLTLYLQSVQGHSALVAGLLIVPLFAPLALFAPFAGRLTSRIGSRLPVGLGFIIAAVGLGLLAMAQPRSSYALLLPAFLLWGVGLGILTPAVVSAAISTVPAERAGLASAINNTARQAGGAIGIAVAGAIAGQPDAPDFLAGFHITAIGAACLYVVAAGFALVFIPGALWRWSEPNRQHRS